MKEIILDIPVDFSMGAVNLMLDKGIENNLGMPKHISIRHYNNGDPDDWFMLFEGGYIVSKGIK